MNRINFKNFLVQNFKLNSIASKLNYQFIFNKYFMVFLFICLLSSIIIRINLFEFFTINISNNFILFKIIWVLALIYSLILIFLITNRSKQGILIIRYFYRWYKEDKENILSIIFYYYIQNLIFIIFSIYIIYININNLNNYNEFWAELGLGFGFLFSLIILHFYPKNEFNINKDIKNYSLWVYLLSFLFLIFYMFIIPLIIFHVINEKLLLLKFENISLFIKTFKCFNYNYNSISDSMDILNVDFKSKDNINPLNLYSSSETNPHTEILEVPRESNLNNTEILEVSRESIFIDNENIISIDNFGYNLSEPNKVSRSGISVVFFPINPDNTYENNLDLDKLTRFYNEQDGARMKKIIKRANNIHFENLIKEKNERLREPSLLNNWSHNPYYKNTLKGIPVKNIPKKPNSPNNPSILNKILKK